MKKIGKLFFLLFIFPSIMAVAGEVSFNATVDRKIISVEESLTLSLTISGDIPSKDVHPQLPELNGFEVMGSYVNSSSNSIYQNGKFQFLKKLTYMYTLLPQQAGKLEIGPAKIEVRGHVLETQPIKITVNPAGANPTAPQNRKGQMSSKPRQNQGDDEDMIIDDVDDIFSQLLRRRGFIVDPRGGVKSAPNGERNAFFITVEANKKRAYVGEQIVATWSLYTKGQIQSFDALKYPDLKGFWKEELELAQRLNFTQEVINGVSYNKAVLVSYALFPISAGKKNIDLFKAKATVIDTSSSGLGVFGLGRPYTYVKSSQELPIDVIPLPTEGRPASFSGAVGKFSITGSLSSAVAKVNQPLSFKIRFQGRGNVKAIELPALNFPSNLEVYDTKKESQFNKNGEGFVEFEVLIIPRSVGEGTIPSVNLSFFDPQTAKYTTQKTPEFKIKVVPGDGSQNSNVSSPLSGSTDMMSAPQTKDLHYLKTQSQWALPFKIAPIFWILLFLTPLGLFAVLLRRLYKIKNGKSKNDLTKRAKSRLKAAQRKLSEGDWRSAGVEITNAVLGVLGEASGTGGVSRTAEEMIQRIPNLEAGLREKILAILSHCELMSFAPEEMMAKDIKKDKKILNEAEDVIQSLLALCLK